MSRRTAAAIFAILVSLGAAGCQTTAPYDYPSQALPEHAFATFQRAWNEGDVARLQEVYAGVLRVELVAQLQANGAEPVSAWYRRGASQARFVPRRFYGDAKTLRYLEADLETRGQATTAWRFSFALLEGRWRITNRIRAQPPAP